MNVERLVKQLKIDEGQTNLVYLDSLGYKTVGIGHMIKKTDPKHILALQVGDKVSNVLVSELFMSDLVDATKDAVTVFCDVWDTFPPEIQEVFINMIFNLGRTRFLKFKKMILAAYNKDWEKVSIEMLDSRWAKQVGPRASRLSNRVKSLASRAD